MEINNHTLYLENKKSGKITSVLEVKNFSENEIKLKLKDQTVLLLAGSNLKIISFDNGSGVLTFVGDIGSVKYQGKSEKFISKVFK